jgi:hypothetical protein
VYENVYLMEQLSRQTQAERLQRANSNRLVQLLRTTLRPQPAAPAPTTLQPADAKC